MRLANGIVLDKDTTFGELKFSALRREVRIQNEDGSVSDEIQATLFRKRYGQNSRWANYKENELNGKNGDGKDGFYSRVGNSFLNICREYIAPATTTNAPR